MTHRNVLLALLLGPLAPTPLSSQVPASDSFAAAAVDVGQEQAFPDTALPACPTPAIPADHWPLIRSRVAPVTFRLPPGYIEQPRHDEYASHIQDWVDSTERGSSWITVNIGRPGPSSGVRFRKGQESELTPAELDSASRRAQKEMRSRPTPCGTALDDEERPPGVMSWCSHPTVQLTSCQEHISGQTVWLASGRATGYGHGLFVAWAQWETQPGIWVSISGSVPTKDRQGELLRMLRTVHIQ